MWKLIYLSLFKNTYFVVSPKILFIIFWGKKIFLWRYHRGICVNLNPIPCLEHNPISKPNINLLPCLSETRNFDLKTFWDAYDGKLGRSVLPWQDSALLHTPLEPITSQPHTGADHWTIGTSEQGSSLAQPSTWVAEWSEVPAGGRAYEGTRVFNVEHEASRCLILPCSWSFCLNKLGIQELFGSCMVFFCMFSIFFSFSLLIPSSGNISSNIK